MKRAYSLVETVIASATLALALTMLMVLVQQYQRVSRQSQASLQRVAPRQALAELAEETRLALEIVEPAGTDSRLVFQRIRPAAAPVVGADPWPAARQMTVTYQLQGQELWRSWQWPGQANQRELVAAEVELFEVRRTGPNELSLRLGEAREEVRLWHD